MKNEIKEIIAERIKYHSNKEKYGYFIGKDCIDICASDILDDVIKLGYRKQSDTVKEFAEKIDLYLIKLFHQANDSQKECEQHNGTVWENGWQRKDERMIMIQSDILPFIRQLAEQYGKEE